MFLSPCLCASVVDLNAAVEIGRKEEVMKGR